MKTLCFISITLCVCKIETFPWIFGILLLLRMPKSPQDEAEMQCWLIFVWLCYFQTFQLIPKQMVGRWEAWHPRVWRFFPPPPLNVPAPWGAFHLAVIKQLGGQCYSAYPSHTSLRGSTFTSGLFERVTKKNLPTKMPEAEGERKTPHKWRVVIRGHKTSWDKWHSSCLSTSTMCRLPLPFRPGVLHNT